MNTETVAQAMAAELGAEVRKLIDVRPADLAGFDLIGFGSGIEGFAVHPELASLVEGLAQQHGQRAFVFTTCASNKDCSGKFRVLLAKKGFTLAGEFHCPGMWTPLIFKVRKGHPDSADIESARAFARGLLR